MNLLPAILFGGPPHAGKSVLFYRLTQALRERGIDHYALRACPDGEGNWFHKDTPNLVHNLRVKLTGEWPPAFVQTISQALEHRSLPFLVDMGGRPSASEECLLRGCTHSVLLLRVDKPEATQLWESLVEAHNLLPLARLISRPAGTSLITASAPVLEGVLTGLERSAASSDAGAGPLFDELLARISALFTSYDLDKLRNINIERAPTELTLDLQQELRALTTTTTSWEPAMIPRLLSHLPEQVPLSVYGSGPNWLYAALAAYEDPQPFYLFDPKLPFGWVEPARVALGKEKSQTEEINIEITSASRSTVLKISFPNDRLSYFQPDPLIFPSVPAERGLIIDGRVPNWLLTALVRLYKAAGVAWIACHQVQLAGAVVISSRTSTPAPGDLVSFPISQG